MMRYEIVTARRFVLRRSPLFATIPKLESRLAVVQA
jgi:hypothetical protein